MDRCTLIVPMLLALAAGMLLPGCSQVVATSDRLVGAPTFPPTNPATVQILRQFPDRSYQRIGDVFIEPQSGNPPEPKIEQALQKEGARMGADAVVIVVDRIARSGGFISGPVDGGTVTPQYGHLVRAMAIKYGTAAPALTPAQQ